MCRLNYYLGKKKRNIKFFQTLEKSITHIFKYIKNNLTVSQGQSNQITEKNTNHRCIKA